MLMVGIRRRIAVPVLLSLLAAAAAVCQMYPVGRRSTTRSQTPDESTSKLALPTFTGIVRGVDKKMLLLDRADQNTMQFYSTGKTQYFDGSKKIKVKDIKTGDRVSVEARLGPDGKPEAVNVRLERDEPPKEAASPR